MTDPSYRGHAIRTAMTSRFEVTPLDRRWFGGCRLYRWRHRECRLDDTQSCHRAGSASPDLVWRLRDRPGPLGQALSVDPDCRIVRKNAFPKPEHADGPRSGPVQRITLPLPLGPDVRIHKRCTPLGAGYLRIRRLGVRLPPGALPGETRHRLDGYRLHSAANPGTVSTKLGAR
jgi:hypothetical protein